MNKLEKWKIEQKEYLQKRGLYHKRPEVILKRKIRSKTLKIQIINHYSNGTMRCKCCSENLIELLTLDHMNNDGCEHRKKIGHNSITIYRELINKGFPEGYQILCHNCNWAKSRFGICPHANVNI